MQSTHPPHAIPAAKLQLVLAAHKLRAWTQGKTCQLAVMTSAPVTQIDCFRRPPRASELGAARRNGSYNPYCSPMKRGHLAALFFRVKMRHGPREVTKTWGVGIRTLQQEPAHLLNGGAP